MICGPSVAVCGSAVRCISAPIAASSGLAPGGNQSAAPAEPMRWALPCPKAGPPNALAKCGKASRYALGSGQVQRVAGSLLKARVRMAKTAASSAAVAASTVSVVMDPRLGPPTTRARSLSAIGLDAIAVGIDGEGGVILRAVVGAQAGLAVVLAAGLERSGVEGVDRGTIRGDEAEMQARFGVGLDRLLGGAEP